MLFLFYYLFCVYYWYNTCSLLIYDIFMYFIYIMYMSICMKFKVYSPITEAALCTIKKFVITIFIHFLCVAFYGCHFNFFNNLSLKILLYFHLKYGKGWWIHANYVELSHHKHYHLHGNFGLIDLKCVSTILFYFIYSVNWTLINQYSKHVCEV